MYCVCWGDYLDQLFTSDRNLTLAVSALTCFLHACRNQGEGKSRKYLARIIWMLTFDDEKSTLAETVEKYYIGISPVLWLPWIPQLLTCLVRKEGGHILNLLCGVGKAYPQAVYFPIRTLYLTLKMEQREKHKADQQSKASTPTATTAGESSSQHGVGGGEGGGQAEPMDTTLSTGNGAQGVKIHSGPDLSLAKQLNQVQLLQAKITAITSQLQLKTGPAPNATPTTQPHDPATGVPASSSSSVSTPSTQASGGGGGGGESIPIRAPASLWRCSRIMHLLRDLHPTLLSALEGIVDQMVWFRENWYEELLRQLNEGLIMCQAAAFASRADVANAQIPPEMFQFVKRLVSTFGIGLEQSGSGSSGTGGGGGGGPMSHESLAKRAQAAAQDPAFQRLKAQFASDFDFSAPGAKRLHTLMAKLKRWIKILELKTKSLQKSFLLEDRCRFLSNFSLATADMDIPGEYLMPKTMPYYVRIARFMPRVEIVQRHHSTVRRLYIQGDNGKIYPYLVVNDTQVSRCRSEERVLQLLAMINLYLNKNKETSRRYLQFAVPRLVAVAPQMRLVEDNTSNISLTDIFKQYCGSANQEWDSPMVQYYERLALLQSQGESITPETLQTLFSQIQTSHAPQTLLREWGEKSYATSTDFWTFRMQFTKHLALCGMAEFVFHLTRLEPDLLYIVRSTGCLTQAFLTFDINKKGELDANRSVPFRLTPAIQHLVSPIGIAGPMHMSMVAFARCLVQANHSLPSILQAVLRDQFITWQKKQQEEQSNTLVSTADIDNETIISLVTGAVSAILTRLHNLAEFEDGSSKVSTFISEAGNIRNLCRMDPAWNPWL
ncbi:Transformation/transcription domain-associated protein [Geodia barretti]|uniref:Transformation/transcription domain-associated protein n=1 Tax=Geodia barretti TaxID=519541 RepID=A0AA35VWN6_GEOBA|nr:Transformation/transcription domain-associated protein [Geodia barretti]